jgi:hypothetical protein
MFETFGKKFVCLSSIVDPDPHWIRIPWLCGSGSVPGLSYSKCSISIRTEINPDPQPCFQVA